MWHKPVSNYFCYFYFTNKKYKKKKLKYFYIQTNDGFLSLFSGFTIFYSVIFYFSLLANIFCKYTNLHLYFCVLFSNNFELFLDFFFNFCNFL